MIQIYDDYRIALNKIQDRNPFNQETVNQTVKDIINQVRLFKDKSVLEYTKKFDKVSIENMRVSANEIEEAMKNIDPLIVSDLMRAKENIQAYHSKQRIEPYSIESNPGISLRQIVTPIEKVGIYVPGGTAAYPSTVLMNAIPAKIAGVQEIIMITPPNKSGKIKDALLVAAKIAGVTEIYKVGGAQGIAALAFGTETIPKVDKIVGPGNIYVAMAKKQVMGIVGIDMIAGPSEICIIADESANPNYIAADLMSQAEHDVDAASICITTSKTVADAVQKALEIQVEKLERKDIIKQSLLNQGAIILVESIEKAFEVSNIIAPEHLEILVDNPESWVGLVKNAGSVFLGEFTPEPVGDYIAGPNHTLPTSGTARFSSGLSTYDFIKRTSISRYDKQALSDVKDSIIRLAEEEGLSAHAAAIEIRFKESI